jgi:Rad3-related DNA helicase
MYALKHEEQVVISTNTKALQDQIFYKDLAYLAQNL